MPVLPAPAPADSSAADQAQPTAAPSGTKLNINLQHIWLERSDMLGSRLLGAALCRRGLNAVRTRRFTALVVALTAIPFLVNIVTVTAESIFASHLIDLACDTGEDLRSCRANSNATLTGDDIAFAKSYTRWWHGSTGAVYSACVAVLWLCLTLLVLATLNAPAARLAFYSFNGVFNVYSSGRWLYAFLSSTTKSSPFDLLKVVGFAVGGTVMWTASDAMQVHRLLRVYLGVWLSFFYLSLIFECLLRAGFKTGDMLHGAGLTLGVEMSAADVQVQAASTLLIFTLKDVVCELMQPGLCSVIQAAVRKQWLLDGEIDKTDEYKDAPDADEALRRHRAGEAEQRPQDRKEGFASSAALVEMTMTV